jgi:hypothetical protein
MNNMTSKYPHQTHLGLGSRILLILMVAFFSSWALGLPSMYFMMWWGYGGYAAIAPPSLQSESMQIAIYVSVTLVGVNGLLFWANGIVRIGIVCAILSPWLLVYLITIPQFFQQPPQAGIKDLPIVLVPVYVLIAQMVIERVFYRKRVW